MKADVLLSVWRGRSESLLPGPPGLGTLNRWLTRLFFWGPLETLNAVGKWLLAGSFLVARQSGIRLSEGHRHWHGGEFTSHCILKADAEGSGWANVSVLHCIEIKGHGNCVWNIAQWKSTCLAYGRPWVPFTAPQ